MHYVFFFPDECRSSALSCYGNPVARMPNYDRLAAEGTLFEVVVETPKCLPDAVIGAPDL